MKKEKQIKTIVEMLQSLDESDDTFLKQIYTIVKKHMERKGRR